MWPAVFSHMLGLAAAFGAGWAIRLMDDALDIEIDEVIQKLNWSERLGTGTTAYALFALAAAALLEPSVALTLLTAAYAVGMLGDLRLLPSGLPAVLEGGLLWFLSLWRFGWQKALAALTIMLIIQLLDDLLDHKLDQIPRGGNWAIRLGTPGVLLVVLSLMALALWLNAWLFLYSLIAFIYFQANEQVVETV